VLKADGARHANIIAGPYTIRRLVAIGQYDCWAKKRRTTRARARAPYAAISLELRVKSSGFKELVTLNY